MIDELKQYIPILILLTLFAIAGIYGYKVYQESEEKKRATTAELARKEEEQRERQRLKDEARAEERRKAETAAQLRMQQEAALRAELQRKAAEDERLRLEEKNKAAEAAKKEAVERLRLEEARKLAEEEQRQKEAASLSEEQRRAREAELASEIESWLSQFINAKINRDGKLRFDPRDIENSEKLDFTRSYSGTARFEKFLQTCSESVTQAGAMNGNVDAGIVDAESFKAQKVRELYTVAILQKIHLALTRAIATTNAGLDSSIKGQKVAVFRIQGNQKRLSDIFRKYKDHSNENGKWIAGSDSSGYGFRVDNTDELNKIAREFNSLYDETLKLLVSLESHKYESNERATKLEILTRMSKYTEKKLADLGVKPNEKQSQPGVKAVSETIYVLRDGRRIRAVSAVDAGDLLAVKDETGKIHSIEKKEIVETLKSEKQSENP